LTPWTAFSLPAIRPEKIVGQAGGDEKKNL